MAARADLQDLAAFAAVVRARGFRQAARMENSSPSRLSAAVRRLEAALGVRLLQRTTRSVALTEAGARLVERLQPALAEVAGALDVVNGSTDSPAGTLKLNVPTAVAKNVLPPISEGFLHAHREVRLEVVVEDSFVDILASGCDAGIRYGERLDKDMIAVPIGPRTQSYAAAAAPAYLVGRTPPRHPRDLLGHACIRSRFASGRMPPWEFERAGKVVRVDPTGPLIVSPGSAVDLAISAAVAGLGIVATFEHWLRPHLDSGALVPLLEPWWMRFEGPFLYYPSRSYMPGPLRAFVDFVRALAASKNAPRRAPTSPRAG